jgi:hypothetical protein
MVKFLTLHVHIIMTVTDPRMRICIGFPCPVWYREVWFQLGDHSIMKSGKFGWWMSAKV